MQDGSESAQGTTPPIIEEVPVDEDVDASGQRDSVETWLWRMLWRVVEHAQLVAVPAVIVLVSNYYHDELDPQTRAFVEGIVSVWWVFLMALLVWRWMLDTSPPAVPSHLHLRGNDGKPRLAVGTSQELAYAATDKRAPPAWLGLGATVLISLGLAGTFFGLTKGLVDAIPLLAEGPEKDVELAISAMLAGAKLAFVKSLVGILLATLWSFSWSGARSRLSELGREFVAHIDRLYPPISSEQLLVQLMAAQATAAEHQVRTFKSELNELWVASDAHAKDLCAAVEQLRVAQHGAQVRALDASMAASKALSEGLTSIVSELRAVRGEDDSSLTDVVVHLRDLETNLPEKIGSSVGSFTVPPLEGLREAFAGLGQGAVSANLEANVGAEMTSLQQSLSAVVDVLRSLPGQVAQGNAVAAETLKQAYGLGADEIRAASQGLAQQTGEASISVGELQAALSAARELVGALQTGGDSLRGAFEGVARPLLALPDSLESARSSVEAVGNAAAQSGDALRSGGEDLAGQLRAAGEQLRDGLTAELAAAGDSLRAQSSSQRALMEAWQEERETLRLSANTAREQLTSVGDVGVSLVSSVSELRAACEQTVAELSAVARTQHQDADDAMAQLLAGVQAFSDALKESQGTIRDASLMSVASTEQVTAAAARQVAEALAMGASKMELAMRSVEDVGGRVGAQSEAFARTVSAAQLAAEEMERHGAGLARSGAELAQSVSGLTAPLTEVRAGLSAASGGVRDATDAMKEERQALTGLGLSLGEQAKLVRTQEATLTERTHELRKLHEVLGTQWVGHVERMADANDRVKRAWQEAMHAATVGVEANSQQIAAYAERVENSMGLTQRVDGLTETLQQLNDNLGEVPKAIEKLQSELERLRPVAASAVRADPSTEPR